MVVLHAAGLRRRSLPEGTRGSRASGREGRLSPRRQAAPDPALRLLPRRDEAAGRAAARHGRGRAQGGQERPGGRPGQGRGEPADPGRARRGERRADAAEATAALRRARSHCCGPGSTREPRPRRRDRPSVPRRTGRSSRPDRPELPAVERPGLGRNPIDRFIRQRLRSAKGSTPSPEADRGTLLRRAQPRPDRPAPHARGASTHFLADTRPGAYERVVDRLLASPHFGERWARPWLDQARYADSNGYNIDAPRSIWKYRDWVIAALNRDMPFDQFAIDQIAGDLRPGATLDAEDRHRLPPQHADQPGRGDRRRAVPRSSRSSIGSTRPARSSSA